MYRHALPPGFVLKRDKKKEEKTDEVSLEELIEEKRAQLSSRTDLTKVRRRDFKTIVEAVSQMVKKKARTCMYRYMSTNLGWLLMLR